MLIKGCSLTSSQRSQVFAAFVYRHLAIGPGCYYAFERAWLIDHAFHFVKDGSRLALRPKYCEPHYIGMLHSHQ